MIKRRKMRLNGVWRRVGINRVYELTYWISSPESRLNTPWCETTCYLVRKYIHRRKTHCNLRIEKVPNMAAILFPFFPFLKYSEKYPAITTMSILNPHKYADAKLFMKIFRTYGARGGGPRRPCILAICIFKWISSIRKPWKVTIKIIYKLL